MAEQRGVSNASELPPSCHTSNSSPLRKSFCLQRSNSRTRFTRKNIGAGHAVGAFFFAKVQPYGAFDAAGQILQFFNGGGIFSRQSRWAPPLAWNRGSPAPGSFCAARYSNRASQAPR